MKILGIFVSLSVAVSAATWEELPLVPTLHEFDSHFNDINLQAIANDYGNLHPWKAGNPLPASFEEAGLSQPVQLVACDIYLDGGSRYYLFRGANKKFLIFCTDPGNNLSVDLKKMVPITNPRLFLGSSHFTDKNKVVVPFDSACERFLLAAIKSEVLRIDRLPVVLKKMPNQLTDPTP